MLDSYFDRRVGNVLLLDPARLVPTDLSAPSLRRETVDGWSLGRRIELARTDLQRLCEGWTPADVDLANAPVLIDWKLVITGGGLAIEGVVAGHPGIARGHRVQTSLLIALDIGRQRWARTVSRFYMLGPNGGPPPH